jgi:drug/metabolite transporter (DMT)-like permease
VTTAAQEEETAAASLPPLDKALPPAGILQLLLLTAAWGGNAPALRYSLLYLPPNGSAALRFILGMAVVVLIARWQGVSLRAPREVLRPLFGISVLFAAQIALLNYGYALTAASRQALLINSYPLYVPLFAHFFLAGDRLTLNKVAGTVLAFIGVLFVFGEQFGKEGGTLVGDGLVLASAVLLAARVVYTSALVRGVHPYVLLFWQSLFALPAFIVASVVLERQGYVWTPAVALSILYQGVVVAGLCFVGWTMMLQKYSASRLSVGFFLTPLFGALASYLVLGEPVTAGLAAGGAAVLCGLLVANRKS